ncbi:hypothetical protein ACRAWF_12415 [Streptomyces sp. L7]
MKRATPRIVERPGHRHAPLRTGRRRQSVGAAPYDVEDVLGIAVRVERFARTAGDATGTQVDERGGDMGAADLQDRDQRTSAFTTRAGPSPVARRVYGPTAAGTVRVSA